MRIAAEVSAGAEVENSKPEGNDMDVDQIPEEDEDLPCDPEDLPSCWSRFVLCTERKA